MTWPLPTFLSYEEVISRAAELIRDRGMREIAPSVLEHYASEACREFARLSETSKGVKRLTLVTGQRLYSVPHDCIRLTRVSCLVPGETDERLLAPLPETDLLDSYTRSVSATPTNWYLTLDRTMIGLYPVASLGGLEGVSTGGGAATITLPATASTTDDAYNDMTVRILDGAADGDERTISDYVGSTLVATVSAAFTAPIVSGVAFQVHPDSLVMEYIQKGQSYVVHPTNGTVITAAATPTYSTVATTASAFSKPDDYFSGCELRFTSGTLSGWKTKITASETLASLGPGSRFTVFPDFPALPANTDAFTVTQIPNVPDEYAHFLSEYVIGMVMRRFDPSVSTNALAHFYRGAAEAKASDKPPQGMEYEGVHEFPYGESW